MRFAIVPPRDTGRIPDPQAQEASLLWLLAAIVLLPVSALSTGCTDAAKAPRPNFVFILADDLGWRDVGYAGSRFYETPHIDALAAEGTVFTEAYASSPVCSPVRASILTGRAPARLHLTSIVGLDPDAGPAGPRSTAPARTRLATPRSIPNLPPEALTFAEVLAREGYATGLVGKWHLGRTPPTQQGFEVVAARAPGAGTHSYFAPYRTPGLPDGPTGEYLTDRLTDEAIHFIEAHQQEPFLLFLSHYAIHRPWQAKPGLVLHYRGRVRPDDPQSNPVVAAMIHSLDESVGRVVARIDELGLGPRTLVVFTSDNGGVLTAPTLGGRAPGGWRITSNAPLRAGKGLIFEGGLRVPLVFRRPGSVQQGARVSVPVVSMDFFPTLLELAGAPPSVASTPDGTSLVPLLVGHGSIAPRSLYFHFPHGPFPAAAIRSGPFKLIRLFPHETLLYDLDEDPGESRDLAQERPEVAARLDAELGRWLRETDAWLPVPNPRFEPAGERSGTDAAGAPNGDTP